MKKQKYVEVTVKGKCALVTIKREEALNALSEEAFLDIKESLDEIDKDRNISCIILTGKGKAFVAGADIAEMNSQSEEEAIAFAKLGQDVSAFIENLSTPVIGAINGFALGGGCELAMSTDIRIASENAILGFPEVSLGIIPGNGGTQRLPLLIGKGMAKYLIMTGKKINAYEAEEIGLVDLVVPKDLLMEKAFEVANMINKNSSDAVSLAKKAINYSCEAILEDGMHRELQLYHKSFMTENRKIGMGAFLKKEKAKFK